jgi:hypothetical protein
MCHRLGSLDASQVAGADDALSAAVPKSGSEVVVGPHALVAFAFEQPHCAPGTRIENVMDQVWITPAPLALWLFRLWYLSGAHHRPRLEPDARSR